jgi:F-box domain
MNFQKHSKAPEQSDLLLRLPLEVLIQVLHSLNQESILALRQLNTKWLQLIDGEDVSRYLLLSHACFTFRGTRLQEQREVRRHERYGTYQKSMQHLSSRLRRLHSGGPAFAYSRKHASNRKFSYGSGFLALELENGEGVEVRDVESEKILYFLNLQDLLPRKPSHRAVANMQIQEHILAVSVVDKYDESSGIYSSVNFILFFSLDTAKLVLKVPRVRPRSAIEIEQRDSLYAFNDRIAVICTIRDEKRFVHDCDISIWSFEAGELMMSNLAFRGITSIAVGKDDMWAILAESGPRLGDTFYTPKRCQVLEFRGSGPSFTKTPIALLQFPADRRWNEEPPTSGPMDFELFKGDSWGIVWRQPIQDGWKVKSFSFTKPNTKPAVACSILSSSKSCFGDRVYVNFESEYIMIPHEEDDTPAAPKLSYISLRPASERNPEAIPLGTVQEHWVECCTTCKRSFPANHHPQAQIKHLPRCRPLEIFGDDEFVLFRMGEMISVFSF